MYGAIKVAEHNLSFHHFSDTCVQTCTYNVCKTFVLTCDK